MILKCSCEHTFQDAEHGKWNRVHNEIDPKGSEPMFRCTVCGSERASGKPSKSYTNNPKK